MSSKTYARNRNSVTGSVKIQHIEAEFKPGTMVDAGIMFIFKRKIIYHLDNLARIVLNSLPSLQPQRRAPMAHSEQSTPMWTA